MLLIYWTVVGLSSLQAIFIVTNYSAPGDLEDLKIRNKLRHEPSQKCKFTPLNCLSARQTWTAHVVEKQEIHELVAPGFSSPTLQKAHTLSSRGSSASAACL